MSAGTTFKLDKYSIKSLENDERGFIANISMCIYHFRCQLPLS